MDGDAMSARSWLMLVLLAAGALPANAQQVASADLVMHYAAVPSLSLQPEVARQYGLTRSAGRALLNVAIRRQLDGGDSAAVVATVTASATNEAGQRQDLRMREVREGDAIYYLGELRIAEAEGYRFEVEARVDGAPRPLVARFSQPFFRPR
jgi:hypothetical protein